MSDVFSSQDALNLFAADPAEVSALASAFHTVARQAQTAISYLQGAHGDLNWTGAAAAAFRTQLGKLPTDLANVSKSYGEVASALDSYDGELGPIRSRFVSLKSQYESLQSQLSTAQGHLSSAQGSLTSAKQAPHAKSTTPAVVNAGTGVQNAQSAVSRIQGEISHLESQAQTTLSQFDSARSHAKSTISGASGVAPVHHWWQSVFSAVGHFMEDTGHVLWGIVKGVGKAAYDLPGDIVHVIENPLSLHNWAKLGEDAGEVAGAIALVAAVIACPADALGFEAVADGAEAVGGVAETASTVSTVTKTGADTGLAAEGEGSWTTVAFDGAGLAVGEIKVPGLGDAQTDAANLEGKEGALGAFQTARASGLSTKDALGSLSDEDRSFISTSVRAMSNPARVSYMSATTSAALAAAKTTERRLDLGNEVVHSVYEHGSDKVKDIVDPEPDHGSGG